MSTLATFVLGVLVGWLIEWMIDWLYWRRQRHNAQLELQQIKRRLQTAEETRNSMKEDLAYQIDQNTALKDRCAGLEIDLSAMRSQLGQYEGAAASSAASRTASMLVPTVPDDLEVINGIGPVIARKLNNAGVITFKQLAALTPVQLREIVGDVIQRLADEEQLIAQAAELAAKKASGG